MVTDSARFVISTGTSAVHAPAWTAMVRSQRDRQEGLGAMVGTSTLIVVPPSLVLDFEPAPGPRAKNQIAATMAMTAMMPRIIPAPEPPSLTTTVSWSVMVWVPF